MRFVTFRDAHGVRAGVLLDEREAVLDLRHASMAEALGGLAPEVADFVAEGLAAVAARIAVATPAPEAVLPLAEVTLLAPFTPRRIFGIAHNYVCALKERGMPHPARPPLFMKSPDTVVGPGEAVALPAGVGGCTYEAELAVVIGRRASRVSAEEARAHVAGYAAFNDVSASQLIRADGSFDRGKNIETFGPFGPYLATVDEIPDPHALPVTLTVDGVTRQSGTTADLLFDVDQLIAILSQDGPLEPGDVIATGTPAGVAPVQTPPTWLTPGAVMRASVAGLGVLENPVVEGAPWNG